MAHLASEVLVTIIFGVLMLVIGVLGLLQSYHKRQAGKMLSKSLVGAHQALTDS